MPRRVLVLLTHKPARILLERPLALGEMRANVFVARSQVDYLNLLMFC